MNSYIFLPLVMSPVNRWTSLQIKSQTTTAQLDTPQSSMWLTCQHRVTSVHSPATCTGLLTTAKREPGVNLLSRQIVELSPQTLVTNRQAIHHHSTRVNNQLFRNNPTFDRLFDSRDIAR